MHTSHPFYRKAFENYLRKGTPIELFFKREQERRTSHYIWRTQGDDKVRASHAANDGKIFAWDSPPPTGHPGEDFGCRCVAEDYTPNVSEYMNITLSGVSDSGSSWSDEDLFNHYRRGKGNPLILREIGLLGAVVDHYMNSLGTAERLKGQIAEIARRSIGGSFQNSFNNSYDFGAVRKNLGGGVVAGVYSGDSREDKGVLCLSGDIDFEFSDSFEDAVDYFNLLPDDIFGAIELSDAKVYEITDKWSGRFEGEVNIIRSRSNFKSDDV